VPSATPNFGQVALLMLSAGLFAAAAVGSILRKQALVRWLGISGTCVGITVLIWHSIDRGSWLPFDDNFDSLVWLALLLALFVGYMQGRRPIGGLDWFIAPVIVLLLIGAAVFGRMQPHEYLDTTWSWFHRIFAYGSAAALLVAGTLGAMYLYADQRIRSKSDFKNAGSPSVGVSLERLEHLAYLLVTLGFAMLTVTMIMGLTRLLAPGRHQRVEFWSPKVLMSVGVWVAFAIVLHTPINPSLRGRKVAFVSVIGCVLLLGTIIATQFMPVAGGAH
jgi:ABC-type uncharacterized transport system permease subunit